MDGCEKKYGRINRSFKSLENERVRLNIRLNEEIESISDQEIAIESSNDSDTEEKRVSMSYNNDSRNEISKSPAASTIDTSEGSISKGNSDLRIQRKRKKCGNGAITKDLSRNDNTLESPVKQSSVFVNKITPDKKVHPYDRNEEPNEQPRPASAAVSNDEDNQILVFESTDECINSDYLERNPNISIITIEEDEESFSPVVSEHVSCCESETDSKDSYALSKQQKKRQETNNIHISTPDKLTEASTSGITASSINSRRIDIQSNHQENVKLDENNFLNDDSADIPSSNEMIAINSPSFKKKTDFVPTQTRLYYYVDYFNAAGKKDEMKKSLKKKRNEYNCKVTKNKLLTDSGKPHQSKTTNIEGKTKVMGDPCMCKNICSEKISNEERLQIFLYYWNLGDHERQCYFIQHYVKSKPKRVQSGVSSKPRLEYTLPIKGAGGNVSVCKKMFLQTLNVNEKVIYTAIEDQNNQSVQYQRERHSNRPRKINYNDTFISVIEHINKFPRKESRYFKKQPKREYLEEKLTYGKMHRLYIEWMKTNPKYGNVTPATLRMYSYIFNTEFNIGFFHPKKDLCAICSLYEKAEPRQKDHLKVEYENHIKNKELVRKIKKKEKKTFDPNFKIVAAFDLQNDLNVPQSEVDVFHYKRKYPVYNFTIYNILKKLGYCYVWHAQIAKRGANEISSCLWIFLQKEAAKGITEFSFYSDNFAGQNRSHFVYALYSYASKKLNVKITHRFLQKGHTQNEGDSLHSCIERKKKHQVIYVPDEMYSIIRNAKTRGARHEMKEMTQNDFFDIKKLVERAKNWEKNTMGYKVAWSKIKEVSVHPKSPEKVYIKYDYEEAVAAIVDTNKPLVSARSLNKGAKNRRGNAKSNQSCPVVDLTLQRLYKHPLPVSAKLHKDLIYLCDHNYIPEYYHTFYKNLRPENRDKQDTDSDDEE